MTSRSLFDVLLIFIIGSLLPLQSGINGRLAKTIANPLTASLISVAVGLISLGLYVLATNQFQVNRFAIRQQPGWVWVGGLIGALYVCSLTIIVPRLGAALSFSLLIGGQLLMAFLIDTDGWFGFPIVALSVRKIVGVLLMVTSIWLVRKPRNIAVLA